MAKKQFVTFFLNTKNVNLIKDVGVIPYLFSLKFGYESTIVTNKNDNYTYHNDLLKGLKIKLLEIDNKQRPNKILRNLNSIKFIIFNSKNIDILNLYHLTPESILLGILYKICNPFGKIYFKLDIDTSSIKSVLLEKMNTDYFYKLYLKFFINYCANVISYENKNSFNELKIIFPNCIKKLIYIPNCISIEVIKKIGIKIKNYEEKENIIISVGRIGTYQKNNEFLLNALKKINLKGWKIYFIGPIEPKFEIYITRFFIQNPNLKNNISFTGNIEDLSILYEYYNKAKIFCLTSRYEGFPIVFPEARFFENIILSTKVGGIEDITNDFKLGQVFSNEIELIENLQKFINEESYLKDFYFRIKLDSNEFIWEKQLKKLLEKI